MILAPSEIDWLYMDFERVQQFYVEQISEAISAEGDAGFQKARAHLAENDLFFLITNVLKLNFVSGPFGFARCREVQQEPNGHLDLWAREHLKSTIITFGLSIFDIIRDPDVTIGIFSHTRPIAKAFLKQIKREMEDNEDLHKLWPHIFYEYPKREAPKWSEDEGIIVKRKENPKESTVEAWGLVDGQPTSKHYKIRVYDDVVTLESVNTPDQIAKTTSSWEMSQSLGTADGTERYIGTRYHLFDTYREMLKRKSAIPRIIPATDDGTETGRPVFLSTERLIKLRRDQGPYVFASQQLLNPIAGSSAGFKEEWIKHVDIPSDNARDSLTIYIMVDPASGKNLSKRTDPDYTVLWVVGIGGDENMYVLDCIRDRLSLTERAKALFSLHRKWKPLDVLYEEYGMQADIEHIEHLMREQVYHFSITKVAGKLNKNDRIRRLVPDFEGGKVFLPKAILYKTKENRMVDLVKIFIEDEFVPFPVLAHDDMLDCLSRIKDITVTLPHEEIEPEKDSYDFEDSAATQNDWMLA